MNTQYYEHSLRGTIMRLHCSFKHPRLNHQHLRSYLKSLAPVLRYYATMTSRCRHRTLPVLLLLLVAGSSGAQTYRPLGFSSIVQGSHSSNPGCPRNRTNKSSSCCHGDIILSLEHVPFTLKNCSVQVHYVYPKFDTR